MAKALYIISALLTILVYVPSLYAQHTPAPNVSGKVEFDFEREDSTSNGSKSRRDSFTQNYQIKLDGSVYSPNLLTYDVMSSYKIEDAKYNTSEAEIKGIEYRANLSFLRKTAYPFMIYANSYSTPAWYSDAAGEVTYNKIQTTGYGISGSAKTKHLPFRYSVSTTDTTQERDFSSSEKKESRYLFSTSKTIKKTSLSFLQEYREAEYVTNDFTTPATTSQSDTTHTTSIDMNSKISKALKFDASADYRNYEEGNNTAEDVNIMSRLTWRPNNRYSANINAYFNDASQTERTARFAMINASQNYQISKELSTAQSIYMYSSTSSDSNATAMNSINASLSHRKDINVYSYKVQMGNTLNAISSRTITGDTELDSTDIAYVGTAATSKNLESIDARLRLNGQWRGSYQDNDAVTNQDKTKGEAAFLAGLNKTVRLFSKVVWTNNGTVGWQYFSDAKSNKEIAFDSALAYQRNIWTRGMLYLNGNVKYGKSSYLTRFEIGASAKLAYRIMRNMDSVTIADTKKDIEQETDIRRFETKLQYRMRSVLFSCGAQYSEYLARGTELTRMHLNFKVARYF